MNKQKITIIVLASILIIFANYFILDRLSISWEESLVLTQELGYQQGEENLVKSIFDNTDGCQATTITFENKSKTIIETKCILDIEP